MTMEELYALEALVREHNHKLASRAEKQAEYGKFHFDDLVEEFTTQMINLVANSYKKEIIKAAKEIKEAGL